MSRDLFVCKTEYSGWFTAETQERLIQLLNDENVQPLECDFYKYACNGVLKIKITLQ